MKVRIRMYRQGLGDCFLLSFREDDDAKHILIDCGSLGATTTGVKMKQVIESIRDTTGGKIHLLIATHEHKDHVSGFLTKKEGKNLFDQIDVDHVWLAWTENIEDEVAEGLKKHQDDLITAARLTAQALEGCDASDDPERKAARATGAGIREVLAFYDKEQGLGARFAKTVHAAMSYVTAKAGKPTFLEPDDPPRTLDAIPGVRFYVLGPPRDARALSDLGHHGDPELYALAGQRAATLIDSLGFFAANEPLETYYDRLDVDERRRFERLMPFDTRHRLDRDDPEVKARCGAGYDDPEQAWRRIDFDWLAGGSQLALQLDGRTNNTSLALAIEMVEDGRVLLFPADAQVGNWLSWHERLDEDDQVQLRTWTLGKGDDATTVTAADLLRRTVFYKVGHHASHNATVREKGLELMAGDGLTAVIPVDRQVALKKGSSGWQMPARGLYRRLIEKTEGRVLRSDIGWARAEGDFKALFEGKKWQTWETNQQAATDTGTVTIDNLFIDCFL